MGRKRSACPYTTAKYKKACAQKLVDLCLESMSPNVIASVTCRPRLLNHVSVRWSLDDHLYIGQMEQPGDKQKTSNNWNIFNELDTEIGKKFRTSEGLLGRLSGLLSCPGFSNGSLVEQMGLFLASEVNIYFEDFRKVYRYIFGVSDVELYAAIKELMRQNLVMIVSVRNQDSHAVGPFILQIVSACKASLTATCDIEWANAQGMGTYYHPMKLKLLQVDGLLMRMFLYCVNELDQDLYPKIEDIEPYCELKSFFENKPGSHDRSYHYLRELMQIRTRELNPADEIRDDSGDEYWERYYLRMVLDEFIEKNQKKILDAIHQTSHSDMYQYSAFDRQNNKYFEETAELSDIEEGIKLLKLHQDELRRDEKTGKIINAEKIMFILNKIEKIFSLKSLYEIFNYFDTDEEVVRRDVRSLCKKGEIVSAGRGLYCSKQYAEMHFSKIGRHPDDSVNETLEENVFNALVDQLNHAIDIVDKEMKRFKGD